MHDVVSVSSREHRLALTATLYVPAVSEVAVGRLRIESKPGREKGGDLLTKVSVRHSSLTTPDRVKTGRSSFELHLSTCSATGGRVGNTESFLAISL